MDHPNRGGDEDGEFPALPAQDGENFVEMLESLFGKHDSAPSSDSLYLHDPETCDFCNQSVAGTAQPALLGQDVGISFEDFVSPYPNSFRDVAGMIQHGALTAPRPPEFAYNENQTLSTHDKELMQQQCDQLLPDTPKMVEPATMPLGPSVAYYSIGQFGPPPAPRTQLQENQMPAGIQDPKRLKKRASDREYRQREKEKKQKLMDENQGLVGANQEKDQLLNALTAQMKYQLQKEQQHLEKEQQQLEKNAKAEEYWKEQYHLLNEKNEKTLRKQIQLDQKVVAMEKKIKNLAKLCIAKPKKKLKKQGMTAETAEETENDN